MFSLAGWIDCVNGVSQWRLDDHSFCVFDGNELVGVLPLHFSRSDKILCSGGWGGSGPVLASFLSLKKRRKVVRAMVEHVSGIGVELDAHAFDFWMSPTTRTSREARWGVNPFVEFGLEDVSGVSCVVDLNFSEDELWKGLSKTARHAVRNAREAGYVVEQVKWSEHLDSYNDLHRQTYIRTGVEPHPKDYFRGIESMSSREGSYVLWAARKEGGDIVAYHNAAFFDDGGMYVTGCSNAQALETGANYLLFWNAMLGMGQLGCRWYDCGEIFPSAETGSKAAGLTTFKQKFGGEPHRFFKSRIRFASRSFWPVFRERAKDVWTAGKALARVILKGR